MPGVRPNVVLIGFMGTGKTAVGRSVAARLGRPFIDTDTLIEGRAGRPVSEIFAEEGEEAFRRLEADVVAAASAQDGVVIATGGGVVLNRENMARLRRTGVIVALRADPEAILARVGAGCDRPLLGTDPGARVRRLLEERDDLYQDADLTLDTTVLSVEDVSSRVVAFAEAQSGRASARGPTSPPAPTDVPGSASARAPSERVVRVALGTRGYDIRIGRGLLPRAAGYLRACGLTGRLALLTHPRLNALYGHALAASLREGGYEVVTVSVPASESSKSLRAAQRVYDALVEARLDRTAALLALGGGVAGDLGGFVAATFLRGIAWAALPTTLLAQVDASIGGKTAVNHPRAKNLIGAVHQPAVVLADIETLRSLPAREIRSGMAEVIKTAVIGAPDLFEYLEGNVGAARAGQPEALAHVVGRCAAYKAEIVAADEREMDGRIVLNYGHTIGHAIEAAVGYRGLTHGEAIAVGMTLEARLAVRLGICDGSLLDRQTRLLAAAGLPVRLSQLSRGRPPAREAVAAAMAHDKKARAGRLRFVLPSGWGRTVIRDDVPPTLLEEVLADG
jgi:shikimate kinase/3-dehydroquinate synthase